MSDLKSKLPNLSEVGEMACKFYKDIKTSVCDIISDYKKKHPDCASTKCSSKKTTTAESSETTTPKSCEKK